MLEGGIQDEPRYPGWGEDELQTQDSNNDEQDAYNPCRIPWLGKQQDAQDGRPHSADPGLDCVCRPDRQCSY